MPDIGEQIVLLGPEEWNLVKPLAGAEHVARRRLTLTFGNNPMLDADALAGQPIRPSRDIAGGIDAGDAGFEVLIDRGALCRLAIGPIMREHQDAAEAAGLGQ
jgi:hypothetical protein